MKKFILLAVLLVGISGIAFASGSGDGTDYGQEQETAVFFNNSGTHLLDGSVVVIDLSGTAGTTLGSYVTRTTIPDNRFVAGVTTATPKGYVVDDSAVVVVTRGPVEAISYGGTDPIYAGSGVGSSAIAGKVGGGSKLGFALESSSTTDEKVWIYVQPGLDN